MKAGYTSLRSAPGTSLPLPPAPASLRFGWSALLVLVVVAGCTREPRDLAPHLFHLSQGAQPTSEPSREAAIIQGERGQPTSEPGREAAIIQGERGQP